MRFLVNERLSEHRYKTPEGYLVCTNAILARTGKQTYRKNEVFADSDDDSEIEIDRKPEEVFSDKTLASFENKPVTVEHPGEDVNVHNHKEYAVGFVRDVRRGEVDGQEVMLGNLVITDEKTIQEIEDGEHTDLSCGYDCDIVDEENPQQRNIRGNHVALCEQGRAGIARIVDSIDDTEHIPAKLKNDLKRYFGQISTFVPKSKRSWDMSDFVEELERSSRIDGRPIKLIRQSVKGWYKTGDGTLRKDYVFTVDGYDDRFMFSIYANDDYDTTEVNAYFLDSVNDAKYHVGYVDRYDQACYVRVDAKDEKEAEEKVQKAYKPYRIFEVRKLSDSANNIDDSIEDAQVFYALHTKYNDTVVKAVNKVDTSFEKKVIDYLKSKGFDISTTHTKDMENALYVYFNKDKSIAINAKHSLMSFLPNSIISSDYDKYNNRWYVRIQLRRLDSVDDSIVEDSKVLVIDLTKSIDARMTSDLNTLARSLKCIWKQLKPNKIEVRGSQDNLYSFQEDVDSLNYEYRHTWSFDSVDDSVSDELIDIPNAAIEEFKNIVKLYDFEIEGSGHTMFGRLHFQIASKQENYTKAEFDKIYREITTAFRKFEDKYARGGRFPITWNFGLTYNGRITAGIDLDKILTK